MQALRRDGRDRQGRAGVDYSVIECADRRALFSSYGEVQSIASAQTQNVLIGKSGGGPEMAGGYGKRDEAFTGELIEKRERLSSIRLAKLPGAKLDRKRRGHLGSNPFADHEISAVVLAKPSPNRRRHRLIRDGRDHE